jgi:tetratricopeptide (TPR) repeat protein
MQTFDQSLIGLVRSGLITRESAMEQASSPSEIDLGLKGISSSRASAQSLMSQLESSQQKDRIAGWMKRGQEYFDKKRYEEARGELKRILQEVPDHKEANALMAQLREFDSKTEKKKDMSALIKAALQMYREGKAQGAILEFQKILDADPENKQAMAYLKAIQDELTKQAKARELYQAALSYQQQHDLANALAQTEQVLKVDPNNEQAHTLQRDLKNAIQKERAVAKAGTLNQSAIETYKGGDLLGALVLWNKAHELNSSMADVAQYLQQGIAQLLSAGVEGLEANPEKTAVLGFYEQGVRSYIHSDFQSAIDFFKKGLAKAAGNVHLNAYLQKSIHMQEQQIVEFLQEAAKAQQEGDLVSSQRGYTKVLRLSPGHPDAVRQLEGVKIQIQKVVEKLNADAKQSFDANDMDTAIRTWERILEIDPANEKARARIEEAKVKKSTLSGIFSKIG